MKRFIFILICILNSNSWGQILPTKHDTIVHKAHSFVFSGNTELGATSIKNDLLSKVFFGGAISEITKDKSFSKHRSNNIVGAELNSEFEYKNQIINLFGNENLGFSLKAGYNAIGSASYSKDAFGLIFYGNENYFGKNADFSNLDFKFVSFQKIGFGILFKKSKSSIHLNYYNIDNFNEARIYHGNYYQDVNTINDSLDINGFAGFTEGKKFNKGFGIGIDFDIKMQIDWTKDRKAYIQFVAKNIGLATINSGVNYISFDSTYHYTGFKLNQLVGENPIMQNTDSITSQLGIKKSLHKSNFLLPCMIQIGKIVDEHNSGKIQSFFGVKIYPTISFIPLAYGGIHYKLNSNIELGIQESFGGFTAFRTGIYSTVSLKKWSIGIATENAIGLVSKNGNGKSLLFRIQCRL